MKKNFAAQPEVVDVVTPLRMTSNINPLIINSDMIFNPSRNFKSDSPKSNIYRTPYLNASGNRGGFWEGFGMDDVSALISRGLGFYSGLEQNKADAFAADRARQIAEQKAEEERLRLEQEKIRLEQLDRANREAERKGQTFRRYTVPIIITTVVLIAGISTVIILKK
jgi:hypothetical protein